MHGFGLPTKVATRGVYSVSGGSCFGCFGEQRNFRPTHDVHGPTMSAVTTADEREPSTIQNTAVKERR